MFRKQIKCCISLLTFCCLASVSPLLDAGDVRATWACVGTGGVGGASRSSGAESKRVGRVKRSRHRAWGATSERGTRASRRTSGRSEQVI
jgi:hypothetical protein